jgi:hypothetical protein
MERVCTGHAVPPAAVASVRVAIQIFLVLKLALAVSLVCCLSRGRKPNRILAAPRPARDDLGHLSGNGVFVIYVVLGILYESFIHPLTILSGLPAAGFGALLMLLLFAEELKIYSLVGIIMLVGLVKKDGIAFLSRRCARASAVTRMMTTVAAPMGTLPIVLGWGAGARRRSESVRRPRSIRRAAGKDAPLTALGPASVICIEPGPLFGHTLRTKLN